MFLCQGGRGLVQSVYDDDFYLWWKRQVPVLGQFPYTELDFRGDNDLVLPPREAWGEIGIFIFLCYLVFYEFNHKVMYIHMYKSFDPFLNVF